MAKGRKRIENLDDLCMTKAEREILRLYYNEGMSWAEISARVYYSVRQCQNIRKRAMKRLSKQEDMSAGQAASQAASRNFTQGDTMHKVTQGDNIKRRG